MGISSQFPYIVVRAEGKGSKLDLAGWRYTSTLGCTPHTLGTDASQIDSHFAFDDIINVRLAKLISALLIQIECG
jgi:hypothetical protein